MVTDHITAFVCRQFMAASTATTTVTAGCEQNKCYTEQRLFLLLLLFPLFLTPTGEAWPVITVGSPSTGGVSNFADAANPKAALQVPHRIFSSFIPHPLSSHLLSTSSLPPAAHQFIQPFTHLPTHRRLLPLLHR